MVNEDYLKNLNVNFFWHEEDEITITSKNWIWCHPKIKNTTKIITYCILLFLKDTATTVIIILYIKQYYLFLYCKNI